MNKILIALALFIAPLCASAQGFIRNDNAATSVTGANLTVGMAATDNKGQIFINPGVAAGSLGKAEDSVHTSGDTGIFSLAVRNNGLTGFTNADGDYSPFAVSQVGATIVHPILDTTMGSPALSPYKLEDSASTSGDALTPIGLVRNDSMSASVNANADYSTAMADEIGRQVISPYSTATNTWQSCSSSNTGTADTAIKAAVASNRIYVTSISCFNTAAVASAIAFKDGATQIYVGGVSNSTLAGVATWVASLNVPLRGTVNTAFNFAMATNATATTCCAAGYISAA